ncbi:MAG TPA: CBS domain-containing protein [Bacteriovoracaceae bacterium]|nr:CBS domain-containing protein [Bacteriovoracaceae bacterium]
MEISDIKVEEFTSPYVISISSKDQLDRALQLMQENGIRHLPVIDDGNVMGMISERDVLTHMGKVWDKVLHVEDIMNSDILSVNVNDNLGDVAFQLSSQKKGSALVLDEDGSVYGIFTTTDALNALVEIFLQQNFKS